MPTLWTRSYYCESVGHISENIIKKYIEDQKSTYNIKKLQDRDKNN
jgi:REP element-mobilizing transposase RayT